MSFNKWNKMIARDKLLKISFVLFGIFPILPFKLKGLPVGFIIFLCLFYLIKKKFKNFNFRLFLFLSSLFLINILSLINTFSYPSNKVETMLSLLLVPLSFIVFGKSINEQHKKSFSFAFVVSSTLLSIYHLIFYYTKGLFHEPSLRVNSFRKAVSVELPLLSEHTIYISMFLGISMLLIIKYYKESANKIRVGLIVSALLMLLNLMLISSKGIVVALFVSSIFYAFVLIKSLKIKVVVILSSLVLFLLSIMYLPTLERRFRELRIASTYNKIQPDNSSSVRIGIYSCVIKTIKEKPILGYGLGNDSLRKCYKETSNHLYNFNFNSHNQYMGYMLNAGVFGLLVLLGFLFFHLRFSLKHADHIYFILMLYFSLVMLTENILERQSGLIIFIFTTCLFFFARRNNLGSQDDLVQ